MKTFFSRMVLSSLTLLGSCKVYQTVPISLNEAHDKGRVKVVSTLDTQVELRNIYLKDSVYFGAKGRNHLQLYPYQIANVYPLDIEKTKKKRRKATIITGATVVGIPVLILAITLVMIMIYGIA